MRLRTSFRIGLGISVGMAAALAVLIGLALRDSTRSEEAGASAIALQRDILERAIARDEYLLFGEDRAAAQWDTKSAQILARLEVARTQFDGADGQILAEMSERMRMSAKLFQGIREIRREERPADRVALALRDRLTSNLLLISYDLSSRATLLAESASRRDRRTKVVTVALTLLIIGTLVAVVAANAAMWSRLIERRVALLHAGAARISSGSLGHRIGLTGDDELAELGQAFDGMAAELERHVTQLQASNRELEAFSYSVSHDLRAPLRHITGFVALLVERSQAVLDEKSRHYLRVISEAATSMGRLIDDLLAFSRMSRAELMPGRVALGPLVDGVIHDLRSELDGRRVTWAVGELPEVAGDAAMLRQVWFNLVANALKFSRPRPEARIEIGAVRADGELQCFVRDNGVGFDMKYADKLFGVFQRLHRAEEFEGNGVGLANVQRIVHRHGGRVWAEGAPDRGAAFWFSLPVKESR